MLVIEKYGFIQERVIGIALKTIAKYGNCFQNNPPVTVYSLKIRYSIISLPIVLC